LIESGHLELRLTQYGNHLFDGGSTYGGTGLNFTNPASVTTIQATAKVVAAVAEACPTNPIQAVASARIQAIFLNDGSSTTAGRSKWRCSCAVHKLLNSTQGPLFRGRIPVHDEFVLERGCSGLSGLHWRLEAGRHRTMTLTWDRPNRQFLFAVQQKKAHQTIPVSDTQDDSHAPSQDFTQLTAQGFAPNCNGKPGQTSMDAFLTASW
jgi:hypothetical protein